MSAGDWRILSDFGQYLIGQAQPINADFSIPIIDLKNEVFALDSTKTSLSLKLFSWAPGKYSRGAIKMHTLFDLRVSIPSLVMIIDGKYYDINILDGLTPVSVAIYLMDK